MVKRKSATGPSSPRKKAKVDSPTDNDAASSSSASTSPANPQGRNKRTRAESASADYQFEELNTKPSAKRARTQSPANSSGSWLSAEEDPDFVPWPSAFDDPESQAHIYYEDEHYTKELTAEACEFRIRGRLATYGILEYRDGSRRYWHPRTGKFWTKSEIEKWTESDLEKWTKSNIEEPVEAQTQPVISSTYQDRSQGPLLSPGPSDDETVQLEIAPVEISDVPSTTSTSPAPVTSPTPSPATSAIASTVTSSTTLPTASPTALPTTDKARTSRQRSKTERNSGEPITQRQRDKRNKRNKGKLGKENEDKGGKHQLGGRRSKTTPTTQDDTRPQQSSRNTHPRRSSRRDAGAQLWCLGDNGEACRVY